MIYKIIYDLGVKEKDVEKISPPILSIIKKTIEKKLTTEPNSFGKPLKHDLKGFRALRVGTYRVIYKVNNEKVIVYIIDIDHRKDVYD